MGQPCCLDLNSHGVGSTTKPRRTGSVDRDEIMIIGARIAVILNFVSRYSIFAERMP